MYCPQCLTEYRDGFYQCADCQVPLVAGHPPDPREERRSNGALELVTVLETSDTFAVKLAKASLEEAGIDYIVSGDKQRVPGYLGSAAGGGIWLWNWSNRIQVAPADEAEARMLLEPLAHPNPDADIETDLE